MNNMLFLFAAAVLAGPAAAQNCAISDMETLPAVVAPCCEAMPGGTCSGGFPNICSYICAESLVPFWNACDVTTQIMPDDFFANEHGFLISGVRDAVQSCRQVSLKGWLTTDSKG